MPKTFVASTPAGNYLYRTTVVESENSAVLSCRIASPVITIKVHADPDINVSGNDPVCAGSPLILSASGGVTYNWTGVNGFSATGSTITIADAGMQQTGTYYVDAKDAFGCSNRDSIAVQVIASPVASVAFTDTSICEGESVMLLSSGGISYTWFPANGLSSSGVSNPLAAPADSVQYKVIVANDKCTDSAFVQVNVLKKPRADAGPDKVIIEGGSTMLDGNVSGGNVQYTWSPAININDASLLQPVVNPGSDAVYRLLVSSTNGCGTAIDSVRVRVYEKLDIPNVFSPNGDGVHDRWVIGALEAYPNFELTIFNRYGQTIFRAKRNLQPWDGTLNKKPVPIGTYYYVLDLKEGGLKYAGFVDIIR